MICISMVSMYTEREIERERDRKRDRKRERDSTMIPGVSVYMYT